MKTLELLDTIARDWATARPDVDIRPVLTMISINRVSALLMQQLEIFFAPFGLTPSSYDVLATLRRSAPPEGLALAQLSTLMAITPPAVTKRVDLLEGRGLVARAVHPTDRRTSLARLTDDGLALVDQVLPLHLRNEERLLSSLDQEQRRTLRELLGRLADQMEEEAF